MKKIAAVVAAVVLVIAMASVVLAETGTIKSVDSKAGTVVFCPEGTMKDVTLKADKSVDLSKLKSGEKVDAMVHGDMLMGTKAAAPAKKAAPVGC